MKITSPLGGRIILAIAATLLLVTSAASLRADGEWDSRHHYRRDNYGYYDKGNHYHHYIQYRGHNGYWDTTGPLRIFINVD
jgi:hypothetical protein